MSLDILKALALAAVKRGSDSAAELMPGYVALLAASCARRAHPPPWPRLSPKSRKRDGRVILLVQRERGPRYAQLVAHLYREGHRVAVCTSTVEAVEVLERGEVEVEGLILDRPPVALCPDTFCGWIRDTPRPSPPMLGLVEIRNPRQRSECERCMGAILPPQAPEVEVVDRLQELLGDQS